jgi:Holliday junction DNA helicase RuvA
VGYRVTVPAGALAALGEPGTTALLFVHTHVREDAIVLYGFTTAAERACFEALIAAHGVGPGMALAILSVHAPVALGRVVANDDVEALTLVPGVGRKTAARLLVELKGRLDVDADVLGAAPAEATAVSANGTGGARAELRAALAGLGYGAEEVRRAMVALPPEGDVPELLRAALRTLAAGAR